MVIELPKNDIYVRLVDGATNLNQRFFGKALNVGDKIKISENPDDLNYYIVSKIFKTKDGLLAIIYTNNISGESVFAIGGSYNIFTPLINPVEWVRDWVLNNLKIGLKRIPPQFYTALDIVDKYKYLYDIKVITGYSLGAIIAGMIAKFWRHSDIKAFLYNGGLPISLISGLKLRYPYEINEDSANILTILSRREPLTRLLEIDRGAGIYVSKRKGLGRVGHSLDCHRALCSEDYKETIGKFS